MLNRLSMKLIYTGTGPAHSCGVSGMGGVYGMMVNGEGVMMTLQTFCKGVYQQHTVITCTCK